MDKENQQKKNKKTTQVIVARLSSMHSSGWFEEEVRRHVENLTAGRMRGHRPQQTTGG